jgi:hypothetical protein
MDDRKTLQKGEEMKRRWFTKEELEERLNQFDNVPPRLRKVERLIDKLDKQTKQTEKDFVDGDNKKEQ